MSDNTPKPEASSAPFAARIDLSKDPVSLEQLRFIRQAELERWSSRTRSLKTRNALTGLAVGALVLGIYGYTFYSVSQERIMDDLDQEAKLARMQEPKA